MDALTLSRAMSIPLARAQKWAQPLTAAMEDAAINTRLRQAAFLAQIGHETLSLVYVKEIGGNTYFEKYGKGDLAAKLGNLTLSDGPKFPGRGLIQVTGRANYEACSLALFGDTRLLDTPELLEDPQCASMSAAWYWKKNSLNNLADADRFTDLTRRINGGVNGLEDRKARYKTALSVLV